MMAVAASPPVKPQICGDRAETWRLFQVHIVLLAPRKVWATPEGVCEKKNYGLVFDLIRVGRSMMGGGNNVGASSDKECMAPQTVYKQLPYVAPT